MAKSTTSCSMSLCCCDEGLSDLGCSTCLCSFSRGTCGTALTPRLWSRKTMVQIWLWNWSVSSPKFIHFSHVLNAFVCGHNWTRSSTRLRLDLGPAMRYGSATQSSQTRPRPAPIWTEQSTQLVTFGIAEHWPTEHKSLRTMWDLVCAVHICAEEDISQSMTTTF